MRSSGSRVLAAIVIGLLSASPSWARVGVASVVDGQPKGLPPEGKERILHVGNDMQFNERVTTGANDKAHIVFLDGSSLTVGPNSVLTIDKFAYDPERKTGELALNASRGVFRFVGGAISKNSEVTIKTPSATMGIRGGIATFAVAATGATTANFLFGGSMTVTSQGVTRTTTQPGSQILAPVGAPPAPPAPIPPGGLGNSNSFQSAGGGQQGGGGQGGGGPGGGGPGGAGPGGGGGRPSAATIGAAFRELGIEPVEFGDCSGRGPGGRARRAAGTIEGCGRTSGSSGHDSNGRRGANGCHAPGRRRSAGSRGLAGGGGWSCAGCRPPSGRRATSGSRPTAGNRRARTGAGRGTDTGIRTAPRGGPAPRRWPVAGG